MTYEQTLDFLFSQLPAYHRIGKAAYKNNLDNTIALDDYFGHPHKQYLTIHIAGTNGKGSVSHMLASVLQEAGYRTGLYTSPHLKDFRERIRVNGKMIPKHEVITFVRKHRAVIELLKPSFFEMCVAMAFDYFARAGVEIAVVETGLGGRLDSTNIIVPILSVITNIGHDHMDLLGDSYKAIATEKAGIIKKGIPVIIGETQKETATVFNMAAAEKGSVIFFADKNFECRLGTSALKNGTREYKIDDLPDDKHYRGHIPLGGNYQEKNLKCVFQAIKVISGELRISEDNLINGIRKVTVNTGLQGRWQILGKSPLVICDTGHNKEGLEYVMDQLASLKKKKLRIVIGFVSDKDLSLVLPLFPKDAMYYFTKAAVPRALNEVILMNRAKQYSLDGNSFPSVREALDEAFRDSDPGDVVFIGGSTFIVAEVV